tara:strand:+ start:528 stop:821 length:294 start_codon:yes stop_codon:yes gene_type:complete
MKWVKQVKDHWNSAKSFIHQGYRHAKGWAKQVDTGAGIFKRLLSAATPMLQDIGGDDLIKQGVGAIDQYNQLRSKVRDVDSRVRGYGNQMDSANIFD